MLWSVRRGTMSDIDATMQFEKEFAAWQGTQFALGHCNGTASLQAAPFGCEVGVGRQ